MKSDIRVPGEMKNTSIISRLFHRVFVVQIMTQLIGIIGMVVDGMVVGKFLGEDAMAAYGFTATVTMVIAVCGSVLSMGTTMVCSKHLGEGNIKQIRHSFSAGFTAALITGSGLFLAAFLFAIPTAKLLGAKDLIVPLTADYLRGYAIAAPGVILSAFLLPVMQMDGEMGRLLAAVCAMTVGDIAADILNVTVFHGGMFGMSLATAFSYLLALLVLLPHFFKKDIIFIRPSIILDPQTVLQILRGGSANAATQCGRMLLTFILNRVLMAYSGSSAVGAHAVITSMGNLCLVPGSAIADTGQMLGGVLCGEEDREGIIQMMKTGLRLCIMINVPLIIIFQFAASPMAGMFYREGSGSINLVVAGFRLFTLSMVFYSINAMYRCFCQGSGQIREALILTALDCLLLPLIAALVLEFTFGVPCFWLYSALGEGVFTVLIFIYFKKINSGASGIESVTPFPKNLGADIEADFEINISERKIEQLTVISTEIQNFCLDHGADRRTACVMALAAEEAVGNILEYGFTDSKQHYIDGRVLKKKEGWILRMRDDCRMFDPIKYLEQYSSDDPAANIGLKMLRDLSTNIVYLSTLNLNNLIITIQENEL